MLLTINSFKPSPLILRMALTADDVVVRVGDYDNTVQETNEREYLVDSVILHPAFNSTYVFCPSFPIPFVALSYVL